ncbi:MAG: hypothetical protein JWO38_7982 [Gemmataceae bacterium]|nr:hypothetical protein [Gemmataceae bacterium]
MKPVCVFGVVGLAAVLGAASPVPAEARKAAAFPAGKYVLGGEKEAAKGDDVMDLKKTFRLKANQYVLSGGPSPTDKIVVDDDLAVLQGGAELFVDDDTVRSTETRPGFPVKYQGYPVVLVLDPAKKVQLRATDHYATEAILGPVWVHRWDGARKKLTAGKTQDSAPTLPDVFFDESFDLATGFEMPGGISHDAETDLPAKPASLLPRFRPGN